CAAVEVVVRLHPCRRDVQRPGAVRQDGGRDGATEGLAGDDDRLERGLERRAPALPTFRVGSGGYVAAFALGTAALIEADVLAGHERARVRLCDRAAVPCLSGLALAAIESPHLGVHVVTETEQALEFLPLIP